MCFERINGLFFSIATYIYKYEWEVFIDMNFIDHAWLMHNELRKRLECEYNSNILLIT
ncbi:MAG: hypothetical protein BWY74_00937 [Firmicutes bacterium ADurb.Bin419]|nr:MAG: hypothetical protein BWY74_00937 [Firmicutes bacterium ADurb.Bin419]